MKSQTHIGNVTLVLDGPIGGRGTSLLLGLKPPKKKSDAKRKRKMVGNNCWVPPGGATESFDKDQEHAALRELQQEIKPADFSLKDLRKVGVLRGYIYPSKTPLWIVHLYLITSQHFDLSHIVSDVFVKVGWFRISKLPFNEMLQGDKLWIPALVNGKKLMIRLHFDGGTNKLLFHEIKEVRSFN